MKENKIKKFIEDNSIDLAGSGSEANSNYCILAGYALFIGYTLDLRLSFEQLCDDIDDAGIGIDEEEFKKVFEYARENDYGEWWKTSKADSFKFEKI